MEKTMTIQFTIKKTEKHSLSDKYTRFITKEEGETLSNHIKQMREELNRNLLF